MTEPRVRHLTVYLGKSGVNGDQVLDLSRIRGQRTSIKLNADTAGDVYTYSVPRHHPSWASFFADKIDPRELKLWTSSASAILLVERGGRTFALTFGYGRHAIRRDAVEGTFGLRVALNTLDGDSVRSIDRKTFEGITTHTRQQASKQTTLSSFGIDADRDLLRAVVGTPGEPEYGKRLSGMDALTATVALDIDDLPEFLDKLLIASAAKAYRKKYGWIDNIQEVRDPSLIDALQAALAAEVVAGNLARKWLAVPDLLEWADIEGFAYNRSDAKNLEADINFTSYLESLRRPEKLTWARMKQHRVLCFSSSASEVIHDWTLTDCIYAELEYAGGSYLLNAGAWFQLDVGYVARLNRAVAGIPECATPILSYREGESEAAYNKRLSASLGSACVMDAKQISYGGGHSSVEYCDVLTSNRLLVHVKRYRGSSVLSHLFAQGLVSATAFASDAEFRRVLNQKLPKAFRLKDTAQRPRLNSYEVAYVIASKAPSQLMLPLFSRVTLKNARQQLQGMGYKVSLTKVEVV